MPALFMMPRKTIFIAARDPIGIRPLFYGYDQNHNIVFASERPKPSSIVEQIFPFPPGHYYAMANSLVT